MSTRLRSYTRKLKLIPGPYVYVSSGAIHHFVLSAELTFHSGMWYGEMEQTCTQNTSGTQSVNITSFCAGTQALALGHQVRTATFMT